MPFSPGEKVGRYTILALVGQGGMGIVYRAHDTHLDRTVALKVLRADEGDTESPLRRESGAARLLREGRAAAAILHPHAVAIFDVGEQEGTPFIAMGFVEGRTLRAHVGDPRISLARRVRWLIDVGSALAAAHRRGVVHRDVKPENVIVGEDQSVKVLDFGIARRASAGAVLTTGAAIPLDSTVFGSPKYMAPEQLRGEPLDGRTDEFAWGILAFELLTGRHPWEDAQTDADLATCILGRELPRPSLYRGDLPEELDRIVLQAARKAPQARFATMDEVIARLQKADLPAEAAEVSENAREDGTPGSTIPLGKAFRSITTRTFGMARPDGTTLGRGAVVRGALGAAAAAATAAVVVLAVRAGRAPASSASAGLDATLLASSPSAPAPEPPPEAAVVDAGPDRQEAPIVAPGPREAPRSMLPSRPVTPPTGASARPVPSTPAPSGSQAVPPSINTAW